MLKQTLALVGLTLSLSANAAIVDLGNITRDTDTGLDWLDVTQTRGLSYNQVTAQLGAGGDYEGYRYATLAELDQLIINFGYTAVNTNCAYTSLHCDQNIGGDSLIVETIISTLGDTLDAYYDEVASPRDFASDGAGYTYGILGSSNITANYYDVARIYDVEYITRATGTGGMDNSDKVATADGVLAPTSGAVSVGSFLVAPTAVPIPAAGWLFMSALVGLVGKKRLSRR